MKRTRNIFIRKYVRKTADNISSIHMYCYTKGCKSKAIIRIYNGKIIEKELTGQHEHEINSDYIDNVTNVDNTTLLNRMNENAKLHKFIASSKVSVCNREPCDFRHENIQLYDKLWIYFHSDGKFRLVSRCEFPKPRGTTCQLCPQPTLRENKTLISCHTKIESWTAFKSHLGIVERLFAEKVAFPGDFNESDLPDVSNYSIKYRKIGQLGDDLQNPSYYIFDIQENKFIYVKREEISRKYAKNGNCNYCPCPRKVASPITFLTHIQTLENRYFCYLVLDDPNKNDRRNQEKLNIFVDRIKEDSTKIHRRELKELLTQQESFLNNDHNSKLNNFEENPIDKEDNDQSSEYLSINGDSHDKMNESYSNSYDYTLQEDNVDDPLMLVNVIENVFKNDCRKFSNYFNQLKSKVNICSLDESLINSQEQLILNKNDENLATKEKNLSFSKDLNLDAEDLSSLFLKHGVPESFRIKNISLTLNLNLNLKPKDDSMINNESNTSLHQSSSNLSTENNQKRPQRAKRSIPFKTMTQSENNDLDDSFSSIENNEPIPKKMFI